MLQKDEITGRTPPSFFSDLDDKERIRLFNSGTIRTFAENELLFKKGSTDKTIHCVLSGKLRVESNDSGACDFRFKAGDLISETGLSAGQGRISSVVAEEASAVFSLDPSAFETLGVEVRTAILKKLHDTVLARMNALGKQKDSAQLREAALTRYVKKSRRSLGKYEQSEIIVNILKNIPRLPLHITQLIELLASQRASAKEVATVAKQDPSLVVDILKTINSHVYALQTEISDVSYAITYLGFNEVYRIAISRGLMKSMPDSDEFREVYHHSVFLSYIASVLCQSYDKNRAALLSTIGLLHDIGQTVLLLLRRQNPKWSLFIEMLDPGKLGAILLKQWNIPKQVCQTIEYQAYPEFCPPAEVPSDQKVNIALLYVAHTACDHLNNKPADAIDHPYLDDYLRQLRFKSQGIDQIVNDNILKGLTTKSHILPDFVRKRLAMARLSGGN